MLSEVTAGGVEAPHISTPLRAFFGRTRVIEGEVKTVDFEARVVRLAPNGSRPQSDVSFDHLVFALGAVPNFFGLQGVEAHSFTFKSLVDAILIRNHVIQILENADAETDALSRKKRLTFVIAGGGFAGAELIGGLNDFVRGSLWYYPNIPPEDVSLILVHSRDRILPELSPALAEYARERMEARGVTFKLGARVADAAPGVVLLNHGETIATDTLIWTAGNSPHPLTRKLGLEVDKWGGVKADTTLAVPGQSNVWAVGDCAAIRDARTGSPCPPTAQHALREAATLAHNIHAAIRGGKKKPFSYRSLGTLAVVGHQTACAEFFGLKFSGLLAWWMWRTIYLAKLPTLEKKLRVVLDWTIDLFCPRAIVQTIAFRKNGSLSKEIQIKGDIQ
jgi:NADH dehydrogenase